ncbi:MAG: flagellar basal body rod protein FlgC [Pseudomonadales bacterium]|jgi:flagellar basal-body rod protein FlgC|nr:flagellar basal body rod protein FlgC [Pseudomonadales bacterium]MDG1937688.1 flagellar basal body rod protein FlgC [Pseudomonadales bacterium]MDG2035209.1 flagellar basal body rod protein FlgC [Pseudomonadales bacterium]
MSLGSVFDIAAMGMSVQTIRLNTTASNMANAETSASSEAEAYKALRPVFVSSSEKSGGTHSSENFGVMVREIVESQAPVNKAYEPNNPQANEEGYVFYSNVNTVEEMADMISASRSFQMNVEMMNTTKSMMQRLLSMGQ